MMYAMLILSKCFISLSCLFPPFPVSTFCGFSLTLDYFKNQILTTLRRNLEIPVTCKIRLLRSPQDTVELARRIEKTGVSALAVHGR